MVKRDFVPSKEAQAQFNALSKAKQIALVRERMALGDSNVDAAIALGATPGQIAGIRNRNNIPVNKEARAAAPADKPPPPYKLAVSRFTACEATWEDGRLCDYEREGGKHFCRLHNWMRKHPRT